MHIRKTEYTISDKKGANSMNKLRINMLATRKTNRILEKYGTAEGYNLDNVHTEPLYEALKAFTLKTKTASVTQSHTTPEYFTLTIKLLYVSLLQTTH